MSLTLVDTAGSASANTYASIDTASTYFSERLHNSTWLAASLEDRKAALIWATRVLDYSVDWVGTAMVSTQALRWPRSGVYTPDSVTVDTTAIPDFIVYATCELAAQLLVSDRFADADTKGYRQMKVGDLYLEIDKWDRPQVLSKAVWWYISNYGVAISGQKRILERC